MEMHSRTAHKGRVNALKARVYYTAEGKMVSYFYEPEEMLVTNTAKGDMSIYTFKTNTVIQRQNFNFGTQSNQLFFFLENNRNDLGLTKMGFVLSDTRFENGLKVTRWQPPLQLAKEVSHVELAHEKGNPIFLGYFNKKKEPLNKVYFYNYVSIVGHSFPSSMTQILFVSPKDSTVTKTTYSGFKVDQEVPDEYLNFKIPADARVAN
jgi:outer membrane lipoprotein-sorting protein